MNTSLFRFARTLIESYIAVVLLALALGLSFPQWFGTLSGFGMFFLQIIFFLSSLRLDLKGLISSFSDIPMLFLSALFMLILFPVAVYGIVFFLAPQLLVPLILLAAMPSGMTSPLLAEIMGGNKELALTLTLTTSFLAPFTVPFVMSILVGTAVAIDVWAMFANLTLVIFVPFIIGQVVRKPLHGAIAKTQQWFKPLSIILLGLLIAGALSHQTSFIISTLESTSAFMLLVILSVFIALLFVVGYLSFFWRSCNDRLTIAVSLTFMNFTLAIHLAATFFPDPAILLPTVLIIIPWALLFYPFRTAVRAFICPLPHP